MTERENILGRIREALQVKAPLPGSHGDSGPHLPSEPSVAHAREWLPAVGKTREEQFELFAKNCADLKADLQRLNHPEELKAALVKIRDAEKWQRIASHEGELSRFACQAIGLPTLFTGHGYD